jgi:hypothetical protein
MHALLGLWTQNISASIKGPLKSLNSSTSGMKSTTFAPQMLAIAMLTQ